MSSTGQIVSRVRSRLWHGLLRTRSYISRPKTVQQLTAVPLRAEGRCERPIIVVGIHRSGTSLLRRVIDSHPSIACPPETYFLSHFARMATDDMVSAGLEGLGFSGEAQRELLRGWATELHETYRLARGKARWADKTPQYHECLPQLRQLLGTGAQFVIITRHPLDVAYSICSRGWRLADLDPDLTVNTGLYVARGLQLIHDFAADVPCHRMTYEELISEPETTLQQMVDYLGEKWAPEMMEYHRFDHNFGTEDPVVRGTKGFKSNSGNWRAFSEPSLRTLVDILEPSAAAWGYDLRFDVNQP